MISKTQQKFKSKGHNVSTEEINKISLNSNYGKKMKSTDSIETCAYGTNSLFNYINQQPNIDKIYLYAKNPYEAKFQMLVNKR